MRETDLRYKLRRHQRRGVVRPQGGVAPANFHGLRSGEFLFGNDRLYKIVSIESHKEATLREARIYEYLWWSAIMAGRWIKQQAMKGWKKLVTA